MGMAGLPLLTVLLTLRLLSNVEGAAFDEAEVNDIITKTFECHKNPALAVVVVKNGKELLSRGYGTTDLNKVSSQSAVSKHTLFGIASVSKGFAATLLVKLLMEKTNLTVDSYVRELLGDKFQMPDDLRTREATFADLMAHRTAVPANNRMRFDYNLTRNTVLERLALLEAPHQFRVKYIYSNFIYGLVTHLAEVIGGKSWEDLVTEHLYRPLGMLNSTFATVADFSREDIAVAYDETGGDHIRVSTEFSKRWAELAGSGSVISTAEDMGKWMNFHLYGGKDQHGRRVMQSAHLKEIHKARFLIPSTSSKETRPPRFPVTNIEQVYAHGFRRGFYRGYEKLSHSGSTFGYRALLTLVPSKKIGVFTVMTGKDNSYVYRVPLHMFLLDKALGIRSWLNASTICSYPAPWKSPSRPSKPPNLNATAVMLRYSPDQYEGSYHNKAYGHLNVYYNTSASTLFLTYGWGTWQLFAQPTKNERFYGKGMGTNDVLSISPIEFVLNPENSSEIYAVKATAFESLLPPIFHRSKNSNPLNVAAMASPCVLHGFATPVVLVIVFLFRDYTLS